MENLDLLIQASLFESPFTDERKCLDIYFLLIYFVNHIIQEKGSNEIVFKAMGRAINKTVTIVELIKVYFELFLRHAIYCINVSFGLKFLCLCIVEKNCGSSSGNFHRIYRRNRYMGAFGGRPCHVSAVANCLLAINFHLHNCSFFSPIDVFLLLG